MNRTNDLDLIKRIRVELSDYYLVTMTASEARTARLAREAADEIERLRAELRQQDEWRIGLAEEELARLRAEQADLEARWNSMRFALYEDEPPTDFELSFAEVRDIYDLRREVADLRADRDRLDWLWDWFIRSDTVIEESMQGEHRVFTLIDDEGERYAYDSMRASIDAARSKLKEKS